MTLTISLILIFFVLAYASKYDWDKFEETKKKQAMVV